MLQTEKIKNLKIKQHIFFICFLIPIDYGEKKEK